MKIWCFFGVFIFRGVVEIILGFVNVSLSKYFCEILLWKSFWKYENHENDYLANAILLCLAKDAKNNYSLANYYNLEKRIGEKVKELSTPEGFTRKESIAELLITISYSGITKFYSFIWPFLEKGPKNGVFC